MRSLRCLGEGRVDLVEIDDPVASGGDALIRIEASAVCGSERGTLVSGGPANTGHEASGIVVESGGSDFRAGDRVGMCAVSGCGECDRCLAGQELHCRRGPTVRMGWHAELAAVPASSLRALPEHVDAGVAAMLTGDPLGVPARGLRRAPSEPGERVLVIGLGPVGLGHVLVRSFAGAEVIGIEPSPYRRELARSLGASEVHEPGSPISPAPRLVIECTGRPECIELALATVDNGGTVLQSGECQTAVPMNPSNTFIRREITYTGGWYYASEDYPSMRELLNRGLPLDQLRTHDVAADEAQGAVTDFLEGRSGKVVLRWT